LEIWLNWEGITFDSGGISIKPSTDMGLMRGDMAGAASVVGAILGMALMKIPRNVIGVMPLCENMPSGTAVKPGKHI
jgi:aminopeptidase